MLGLVTIGVEHETVHANIDMVDVIRLLGVRAESFVVQGVRVVSVSAKC